MNKPKIFISAVNFSINSELENYCEKKINKLSSLFEKIVDIEVIFKLDSESNPNNKISEIKLKIPKHNLFSKKESNSFEDALDKSVEALRRQLLKHKDKF